MVGLLLGAAKVPPNNSYMDSSVNQ